DPKGESDDLLKSGEQIGVNKYLVCSTATTPEQVIPINNFIYEQCKTYSQFIGFATLHPDMINIDKEVERIIEMGFKGIKLHPDFQQFNIDDSKAEKIYSLCQGSLAILFHTGDNRYSFSQPSRLSKVAKKFPNLLCIAAHFGGFCAWEEAYDVYDSDNIYMDTSSSLFQMSNDMAYRFFEKFTHKKFFWGSDFPMWTHKEELDRFLKLKLSNKVNQDILYNNFANCFLND
ncbi:MAG: amidohydrolase family protein, partial [Oscillospiraceae bacterium]